MSTYVFSDLHAQYNLWQQIKDYIKPDDIIFCLGDCVDRGPAGLEILYEVMETPNITLLRGNHEDFIATIGEKILKCKSEEDVYWDYPDEIYIWQANGASNTIEAFQKLSRKEKEELINKIKKLPTWAIYENKDNKFYLCHAGRQPRTTEHLIKEHSAIIPMNNYIWDRDHISDIVWLGEKNEFCVHGHTPVLAINHYINRYDTPPKKINEIYTYCDGHKIDIDLGSFITHRACLFNLDTFEPIYFEDK